MIKYDIIKKSFYPLRKNDYKIILVILLLTVFSSFAELISIGLIIPVLNLFVGNDYQDYLKYFNIFNLEDKNEILIFILVIFLFVHSFKFLMNRSLIFLQNKFSHNLYTYLAKKLFNDYINKDYTFFINKSSSELTRNILTECNLFSFGVIYHIIRLTSDIVILSTLLVILFILNFQVTLVMIIYFGFIAFYFYKTNSLKLSNWGERRQYYSFQVLKQLQESFSAFRELILNNLQKIFFKSFSIFIEKNAEIGIKRDNTLQIPRLVLELATIIILVIIISYLLIINYEIRDIFVLIGIFFYSAIRILPSTSKIIHSTQSLKNNAAVINIIYNQLQNLSNNYIRENLITKKFNFNKIKFSKLKFFYKIDDLILNNVNLEIRRGEKIGLVGKSGSGKSTFINLFSGLLKPSSGNVFIDDKKISEILKSYQNEISYVPQKVTIFDESILFNIALEYDIKKIDLIKLKKVLKEVDLYNLIYSLPNNISEKAGENGSRFSGGQCQRIGIARALYKNTNILILDEATSALDFDTENRILKNLFTQYKEKTILLSTHRTNPLKFCDIIYKISNKKLEIESLQYVK